MTLFLRRFVALALLVGTASANSATAQVLDQEFDPVPPNVFSGVGITDKAQTFTVGISGQLVTVDVYIYNQGYPNPADLEFDVRGTIGGVPLENDALTLAAVSIPAAGVPTMVGWFSVDISAFNVLVNAGDVLAIALRAAGANTDYSWEGQTGDPYPAGRNYFRNSSQGINTWTLVGNGADLGFRTWVQPSCILNCPAGDGYVVNNNGSGNKSPDMDGSASVNLADLSIFALAWPPGAYDYCADFDCNGVIALPDLAQFAAHWPHVGPLPGICQ